MRAQALNIAARRPSTPLLLLGALASAVLFAALTYEVLESGDFSWDSPIAGWVHRRDTAALDAVMQVATTLGGFRAILPLTLAAFVLLLRWRRHGDALFVVVVIGGIQILNPLLKELIDRERPHLFEPEISAGDLTFPSGHAASTMALLAALVIVLWGTRWRWHALAVGGAWVAAVGLSRVYLGVHFPSDVLAGWAVALAWVLALELTGLRRSGLGDRLLEPLGARVSRPRLFAGRGQDAGSSRHPPGER